jgi:hypothetical protein
MELRRLGLHVSGNNAPSRADVKYSLDFTVEVSMSDFGTAESADDHLPHDVRGAQVAGREVRLHLLDDLDAGQRVRIARGADLDRGLSGEHQLQHVAQGLHALSFSFNSDGVFAHLD